MTEDPNFCLIHNRPKVASRMVCPSCLAAAGKGSPARRRAAHIAAKAAGKVHKANARNRKRERQKREREEGQ